RDDRGHGIPRGMKRRILAWRSGVPDGLGLPIPRSPSMDGGSGQRGRGSAVRRDRIDDGKPNSTLTPARRDAIFSIDFIYNLYINTTGIDSERRDGGKSSIVAGAGPAQTPPKLHREQPGAGDAGGDRRLSWFFQERDPDQPDQEGILANLSPGDPRDPSRPGGPGPGERRCRLKPPLALPPRPGERGLRRRRPSGRRKSAGWPRRRIPFCWPTTTSCRRFRRWRTSWGTRSGF